MQHMCNFDFMSVAIFKSFFALHTIFSLCCDTECLLQHCKEGDGYQQKSPHTYSEYFEGLNILDAAQVHNYVRKTKHTYATTEFYPFLQLSIKLTLGMHEFPCHCTTRNVYALYVCHYRKPGMGRCPQSSPYSMSMPAGGPGMPLLKSSNYKPLSTSPIPT